MLTALTIPLSSPKHSPPFPPSLPPPSQLGTLWRGNACNGLCVLPVQRFIIFFSLTDVFVSLADLFFQPPKPELVYFTLFSPSPFLFLFVVATENIATLIITLRC